MGDRIEKKYKKRNSAKRHSAKKSSLKKTKPSKIRSEYNMKGMGILLNMYGGAVSDLENDLEKLKLQLKKHIRKYKSEKDLNEKKKLKTIIKSMKIEVSEKSNKINDLLEGITDTASKAYGNTKYIKGGDVGTKISSFLKTTTGKVSEDISKTIDKTISEGVKVGSKETSETIGKSIKAFSESTQDESKKLSSKLKKLKIF